MCKLVNIKSNFYMSNLQANNTLHVGSNLSADIASSVAKELNIKLADVSTVSTNKKTQDGEEIMGGYHEESGDIAINDKNIDSTGDAMNTLGHEIAHSLDTQRGEAREGTTASGQSYSDEYANIMGAGLEDYAEFAMYNYTDKTLATTNNHVGLTPPTSVFDPNYDKAAQNFDNRVDAGAIDYKVIENVTLYGEDDGNFISLKKHVDVTYETTLPEMFSAGLENPEFRDDVKDAIIDSSLSAASLGVSVLGFGAKGVAEGVYFGVGAVIDITNTYRSGDATNMIGTAANIIPGGKTGSAIGIGASTYSIVK